jgi:hypothetical protein
VNSQDGMKEGEGRWDGRSVEDGGAMDKTRRVVHEATVYDAQPPDKPPDPSPATVSAVHHETKAFRPLLPWLRERAGQRASYR